MERMVCLMAEDSVRCFNTLWMRGASSGAVSCFKRVETNSNPRLRTSCFSWESWASARSMEKGESKV